MGTGIANVLLVNCVEVVGVEGGWLLLPGLIAEALISREAEAGEKYTSNSSRF